MGDLDGGGGSMDLSIGYGSGGVSDGSGMGDGEESTHWRNATGDGALGNLFGGGLGSPAGIGCGEFDP